MLDSRRVRVSIIAAFFGGGCAAADSGATAGGTGVDEGLSGEAGGGSNDPGAETTAASTAGATMPVTDGGADEGESTAAPVDPPVVWDVGILTDVPGATCGAPTSIPCDDDDDDPWHAMGINCDVGPQGEGQANGDPQGFYVHTGNVGTFLPPPFPPREGEKILIISSGRAADMVVPNAGASTNIMGFVDNNADLPPPINVNAVSAIDDCATDDSLVGTGDCSNTLQEQWEQGSGANDYTEMRLVTEVPFETYSFSYDFAMFSVEYPVFYQSSFNDMYIGWLESELWTGNISFDEMGRPISLNAGFLDYKDAPNPIDCPAPCQAPELAGTAMIGHAGTKWLTTTAGVSPGEEITIIFAVFDLSDGILDTVVLLDNFQWGCSGGAPVTIPG